jgi:hypothetical protein
MSGAERGEVTLNPCQYVTVFSLQLQFVVEGKESSGRGVIGVWREDVVFGPEGELVFLDRNIHGSSSRLS